MQIDRNSWHYWLYNETYDFYDGRVPKTTNLCQYCWRIMLLSPVVLAIYGFCIAIIGSAAIVVIPLFLMPLGVAALLAGSYPTELDLPPWKGTYAPFKTLGFRWYPLHLVAPIAAYLLLSFGTSRLGTAATVEIASFAIIYGYFVGIGGMVMAFTHVRRYDAMMSAQGGLQEDDGHEPNLPQSYLRARKQRVCPLVTFK